MWRTRPQRTTFAASTPMICPCWRTTMRHCRKFCMIQGRNFTGSAPWRGKSLVSQCDCRRSSLKWKNLIDCRTIEWQESQRFQTCDGKEEREDGRKPVPTTTTATTTSSSQEGNQFSGTTTSGERHCRQQFPCAVQSMRRIGGHHLFQSAQSHQHKVSEANRQNANASWQYWHCKLRTHLGWWSFYSIPLSI